MTKDKALEQDQFVDTTKMVAQKQEPVGYFSVNDYGNWQQNENGYGVPFYDAPQVTTQVIPLTDYQAIEQAEKQEPVAWMYVNTDGECEQIEYGKPFDDPSVTPLYTSPPQRQSQAERAAWVGLTKQDAEQLVEDCDWYNDPVSFCFDVEAKLKEKNT